MPTLVDGNLLFGVVALESERISHDDFLRAASEAYKNGETIRACLIRLLDLPESQVSEIDALVHERRKLAVLDSARPTSKVPLPAFGSTPGKGLTWVFSQRRYELEDELGRGGLGVVKKVYDSATQRSIAYKTLRMPGKRTDELRVEDVNFDDIKRFREEALVCAQLEHPNIVPVYEIGEDARGLPFYTMRAIAGKTLTLAIAEYHNQRLRLFGRAAAPSAEELNALSLMRSHLYHTFADTCKAIAYAHAKGVIHRDLKSDNIMVGAYGETILLDWGIAKVKTQEGGPAEGNAEIEDIREQISSMRDASALMTMDGAIMGTPSYMSPEQASGQTQYVDELSDVYSLGAILYEILVGTPPFYSADLYKTLEHVLTLPALPPLAHLAMRDATAKRGEPLEDLCFTIADLAKHEGALHNDRIAIPAEIESITMRAIQKQRVKRFTSAKELYDAVLNFLEGSKYQQQQRGLSDAALAEAQALITEYRATKARVLDLEVEEAALRSRVKSFAPIAEKQPLWKVEDNLRFAHLEVTRLYNAAIAKLTEANGYDNTSREARKTSAEFFWEHLLEAEDRGAIDDAQFFEAQVRIYDDGDFRDGLKGNGSVTLTLDDPDADILCFRYYDNGRRAIPVALDLWDMRDNAIPQVHEDGTIDIGSELHADFAHIGRGALDAFPLEMGSYILLIRSKDRPEVRLPIHIERSEALSYAVEIPKAGVVLPDFCYVPSSRFVFGGDPLSNNVHRQELDNDAFAIARFPVQAQEYLAFLNELELNDALARQPREGYSNEPLWTERDGSWSIPSTWKATAPVVGISWEDAQSYAAWLSAKEGRNYALPTEAQWEHAARGADGRFFPWGMGVDATFLNAAGSRENSVGLVPVDSYPIDESPFGVRGMGGNVRDWCLDNPGSRRKDLRIVRGGFWSNPPGYARSASRPALNQRDVSWEVGFRLVQVL